jgi:hypothetical protein
LRTLPAAIIPVFQSRCEDPRSPVHRFAGSKAGPESVDNDVGVDPHKKTLTATVLDGRGGTVATASFKVSGVGHRVLLEWATSLGPVRGPSRPGVAGGVQAGTG